MAFLYTIDCDRHRQWLSSKESPCNTGDPGSIPGSGRSPGEGNGKPTPEFLPGKTHRQRRLGGYNSWDCKESDMTEQLSIQAQTMKYIYTYS